MTIPAGQSTAGESVIAPVAERDRIMSLDTVRGVALFGILLMNILGFGYGRGPTEFRDFGGVWDANLWSWFITDTFFEGTQRTIFSLLFGAGVILLTSSAVKRAGDLDIADVYYRRTIWLIAFGMIHAYVLLWDGDILYYYGIAGLFLFPLRNLAPRRLIGIGVAGLLILSAVYTYDAQKIAGKHSAYTEAQQIMAGGGEQTDERKEAVEAWEEVLKDFNPPAEKIQKQIGYHTGSYWGLFVHHAPDIAGSHSRDTYRYMFLDAFAVMVIGMALMKLGVFTLARPTRFYWTMVFVGYGIGVPLSLHESFGIIDANFDILALAGNWSTYDLGRLSNGLGHLGVLLLFCRSGRLMWLQRSLAAVGRMALTNYIMHSVICAFVFLGVGFGLYGSLERYQLYYVVVAIWIFQLIVSPIWLRHFRFGPLEWVWRSLTYMKKQPMRRAPQVDPGILPVA
jgi:uncharacterized protein